uniref:Uncharacterized protein n=1 Tax=Tanacetum cinerariifolium TaxID=118510 RepID=A0A6L2P6V0_TANCI|nr:hypothetical protein [Tanacetum cinerariifolium]
MTGPDTYSVQHERVTQFVYGKEEGKNIEPARRILATNKVRRKQGGGFTSNEIAIPNPNNNNSLATEEEGTESLAAQAIRASSAHRDSSLSSAYGQSAAVSPRPNLRSSFSKSLKDDSTRYGDTSKNLDEPKRGFWGALARKARAIIDDEDVDQQYETPEKRRQQMSNTASKAQTDNPALQKGLNSITSSLNYIGGTIGNALEEGMTVVENRTADIIQETRKLNIKKKAGNPEESTASNIGTTRQLPKMHAHTQPQMQTDTEIQLKASRDVSMAMAAKAKLLLRELKTVKADLAFAKERCAQLEEENRILRETGGEGDSPEDDDLVSMAMAAKAKLLLRELKTVKADLAFAKERCAQLEEENRILRETGGEGDSPEDDDLIRLQLESLLAEKARLAQENSVYARENRFLREIVEYHQLTMQDVVYIDEHREEVSEVYPIKTLATNNLVTPSTPRNTNPHVIGGISSPPLTPTSPFVEDQYKM